MRTEIFSKDGTLLGVDDTESGLTMEAVWKERLRLKKAQARQRKKQAAPAAPKSGESDAPQEEA